jgi:ubiquinone/menaquinone biosynthesis C-methylase UbiE
MSIVKVIGNIVALSAGVAVGAQAGARVACELVPHPLPHQLAGVLDAPLRLRYRNLGGTLDPFGLVAGMTVLEVGCGTGFFTQEIARRVGREGMVHAVDIQKSMLETARQRLAGLGMAEQVQFHHAGANSLPLPDGCINVAVLINVLAQIPDKLGALAEIRRVLRPGGRVALSEELPSPAYLPAGAARRLAEAAGLRVAGKRGTAFCYSMLLLDESVATD